MIIFPERMNMRFHQDFRMNMAFIRRARSRMTANALVKA
jgi:hypothetical protein